jgi:hypothetical protein
MRYYLPFLVNLAICSFMIWMFLRMWRKSRSSDQALSPWFVRHHKPITVIASLLWSLQIYSSFTQIRETKIQDFDQALRTYLITKIEQSPVHNPGAVFTRESVFTTKTNDDGLLLTIGFHADLPGDENDVRMVNDLLDKEDKKATSLRQQWADGLPCYVPGHFRWMNSYRFNNGSQISRTFIF